MKKTQKILALVLCAVLLVAGSVMGTLAYLTSQTEVVTNTFTVGDVEIYLDEKDIDGSETKYGYDALLNDGRDLYNAYEGAYKLVPGCKHEKDPTVWIKDGSEQSYVRMMVTVSGADMAKVFPKEEHPTYWNGDIFLLENLVEGWDKNVWECVNVEGYVYEFRYYTPVAGGTNSANGYTALPALFSHVKLPGEGLTNDELAELEGVAINVEAHAIQTLGFEGDVDKAWAAFDAQ